MDNKEQKSQPVEVGAPQIQITPELIQQALGEKEWIILSLRAQIAALEAQKKNP